MSISEDPTAFPLSWPIGKKRTEPAHRRRSRFRSSFASDCRIILGEIKLLHGRRAIISTNLPLRRDGLPYASRKIVADDPGVAVYFIRKEKEHCFACDEYASIDDNLHAIVLTINALRGISRWGTGDMLDATFQGFLTLPPADSARIDWLALAREFGECIQNPDDHSENYAVFRRLVKRFHPDVKGNPFHYGRIIEAWNKYYGRIKNQNG